MSTLGTGEVVPMDFKASPKDFRLSLIVSRKKDSRLYSSSLQEVWIDGLMLRKVFNLLGIPLVLTVMNTEDLEDGLNGG